MRRAFWQPGPDYRSGAGARGVLSVLAVTRGGGLAEFGSSTRAARPMPKWVKLRVTNPDRRGR